MALPIWAKVGIGWSIATVVGIYAFVEAKKDINAKRYEIMKARQRLRNTNIVD